MLGRVLLLAAAVFAGGCAEVTPTAGRSSHTDYRPGIAPYRFSFREGDVVRYQVSQRTTYEATGEIVAERDLLDLAFSAVQVHAVTDVEGESAKVEVSLEEVHVRRGGEAFGEALARHRTLLLVLPNGLAVARHVEPGIRAGPEVVVAYAGAVLPDRPPKPGDEWTARLSFPVGRLLGRVVPSALVVPIEVRYRLERYREGLPVLLYRGEADLDYRHAAESASGRLSVEGRVILDTDGTSVMINDEQGQLEAQVTSGGASGSIRVAHRSEMRRK